jgi:hypothetical protein
MGEHFMNVLQHICAFNAIKRAITKNDMDIRKPELNAGRHQAIHFLFVLLGLCKRGTKKYEVHLKMPKETHTCDCARFHQ